MGYEFYLDNMLLPIAPQKLSLKINNQNKTYSMINDGEINVLKSAGLTDIEFEFLLPNVKYPFAVYKSNFETADVFLEKIEKLKTDLKPFQFIVVRKKPNGNSLFGTNMKVSLEDYTIKEDAKEGMDIVVSIKLKQYKEFGTKTCNVIIKQEVPKANLNNNRETTNSPAPSQNQYYTVKKGDCLWNIAKKFYGNGSKYGMIYNANKSKIKNPNLIYPGQVLLIPVDGTISNSVNNTSAKKTTSSSKKANNPISVSNGMIMTTDNNGNVSVSVSLPKKQSRNITGRTSIISNSSKASIANLNNNGKVI